MDENYIREFLLEQQSRSYSEVRKLYAVVNREGEDNTPLDTFFDSGEFLTLCSGFKGTNPFNYSVYHSRNPEILDRFREGVILMARRLGEIEKVPYIMQWGIGIPNKDKSYTNSRTTLSVLEAMAVQGQLEKVKQQSGWGDFKYVLPK